MIGALGVAAHLHAHRHLAVADAEHRKTPASNTTVRRNADCPMSAVEAGPPDRITAFGLIRWEGIFGQLEGNDLGIDPPPRATRRAIKLGDLAAEIDDEDGVGVGCDAHVERIK